MTSPVASCVVAVDVGSSGVRAVAYTGDYGIEAGADRPLEITTGADGRSTQSWRALRQGFVECVAEVARAPGVQVEAVVCSGTASCLAVADRSSGEVLGDEVVLWSDARAVPFQDELPDTARAARYLRTLCPAHASYWPSKLRWLVDGGVAMGRSRLVGAKDLLFQELTGEPWTDPMTAAATGVFDSRGWCWDEEVIGEAGARAAQLPEIHPATSARPGVGALVADAGLPSGVPVVLGGMDGPLAQLGAAGWDESVASCTVGTSIACRVGTPQRAVDPAGRLWCYPVSPDRWVLGGAGSNGGNVLTWLASMLGGEASVGDLLDEAFRVPPDTGLLFIPYLNGERSPLWREELRGGLVGLRPHHRGAHIARAALEGVGLAVAELAEAIVAASHRPESFALTGGFVRRVEWAQLVTDALGCATYVPQPDAATCTGAAVLGWAALGSDSDGRATPIRVTQRREPDRHQTSVLRAKGQWLRQAREAAVPPIAPDRPRSRPRP